MRIYASISLFGPNPTLLEAEIDAIDAVNKVCDSVQGPAPRSGFRIYIRRRAFGIPE